MQLDLQGTSFEALGSSFVSIGGELTQVWQLQQAIGQLADPRILGTRFTDWQRVNVGAEALIHAEAAKLQTNVRSRGGKKVRSAAVWDCPELQLLTQRALMLLCRVSGAPIAHVVDRWANVMVAGEFSTPHSHYECDAAVVYSFDPGDTAPEGELGGELGFMDPRIPFCCPLRPGRPTRHFHPSMKPGSLVIFPSEFLHFVNPYYGNRPRVTLAWNLSIGPIPPGGVGDYTQQDRPIVGKM